MFYIILSVQLYIIYFKNTNICIQTAREKKKNIVVQQDEILSFWKRTTQNRHNQKT